jgi:hypothetical protein
MTAKAVRLPVKKSVILEVVVALKVVALMELGYGGGGGGELT